MSFRDSIAKKMRERKELSDRLCACGCGTRTFRGRGIEPNAYIRGHGARGKRFPHSAEHPRPNYKGRRISREGYVLIPLPDHPRASHHYVAEHILVVEKALGKPFGKEHPVHHVDHDRANNANGNLVLCEDTAYHSLLHRREAALVATGDPNKRLCGFCSHYDDAANMTKWGSHGGLAHRECARKYKRQWDARRRAS